MLLLVAQDTCDSDSINTHTLMYAWHYGISFGKLFCNSIVPFSDMNFVAVSQSWTRPLPGVSCQVRNRVLFIHVQITGVC